MKPFIVVRTSKVPLTLSSLKKGTLAQATNNEDTAVVRAFACKNNPIMMTLLTEDDDDSSNISNDVADSQVTVVDVEYLNTDD